MIIHNLQHANSDHQASLSSWQVSHKQLFRIFYFTPLLLISGMAGAEGRTTVYDNAGKEAHACTAIDSSAPVHQPPPLFPADEIRNTEISADFSTTRPDGSTSLYGDVIIRKNQLLIRSDEAHYSQSTDSLNVNGNVHVDTSKLSLNADKASFSLSDSSKQGEFKDAAFIIPGREKKGVTTINMKGRATSIISGNSDLSRLKQARITSCQLDSPDWLLSADEIELDHADEYGRAHDVVIEFKDIPFLYTPYMEFPISDKRRTGLLFPEFGTSSSRGVEFAQPWYWNIAPEMDAIFTPRNMVKRGLELGGEYRYLTRSTSGKFQGAYLKRDKITDQERYLMRYTQRTNVAKNMRLSIDLQDVSDKDYFNDFSNSLGVTSQTHLDRKASLNYNLQNWQARALVQKLKTIDTDSRVSGRPYARLPQLTLKGREDISNTGLEFTFDSEAVEFDHEDDARDTGARITLKPGIHLPLSGAAWFVDPALKLSHTRYEVGPDNSAKLDLKDRNLPITSIDAGLFFERPVTGGLLQTLEPRMYYLYVPYEDQDNIPVFDTSSPTFSVAQLFRDNRFSGGDRIGDANQTTLALTSRLLDPATGDQILRASIGQIFYFDDRRVSLNGVTETRKRSDIITELDTQWNAWSSSINVQWNPDDNVVVRQNYFLQYKTDNEHIFNIGFRKRLKTSTNGLYTTDTKQTDTSMVIPLTDRLSAYARWNYSLEDHQNIDAIGGFSYDSCCWSVQLLMQRRLQNSTSTEDAYDNSLLVQFVLKGLGSLSGSKARTTLKQSILGYEDTLR